MFNFGRHRTNGEPKSIEASPVAKQLVLPPIKQQFIGNSNSSSQLKSFEDYEQNFQPTRQLSSSSKQDLSTVSSSGYNSGGQQVAGHRRMAHLDEGKPPPSRPYDRELEHLAAGRPNGLLGARSLSQQRRRRQTLRVAAPMVPILIDDPENDEEGLDEEEEEEEEEDEDEDGDEDGDDSGSAGQRPTTIRRRLIDGGAEAGDNVMSSFGLHSFAGAHRPDCVDSDDPSTRAEFYHEPVLGHLQPPGPTFRARQVAALHFVQQQQRLDQTRHQLHHRADQTASIYFQPEPGEQPADSFLYQQPHHHHLYQQQSQHHRHQHHHQHQFQHNHLVARQSGPSQRQKTSKSSKQVAGKRMQSSGRQHLASPSQHPKRKSGHSAANSHGASGRSGAGKHYPGTPIRSLPKRLAAGPSSGAPAPSDLGCCGKLAKMLLFISNALFWCAGIALGAWGTLALVDDHKNNLSQLLVFESASRMSLFQLLSWSFITLGCATILVGFCGCSALFRNNRWILGLYIFLILAIFALDLATGLLAIIFQERLVANVRLRLVGKLRNEYGVQASFTTAIDYIQTRYECCGMEGHFDYDQSLWRLQRLGGFEATVARTCCHLRNTFDEQAHVNPRPVNESMCQSTDVRFHQSYRYRRGCLDDLERLIRHKIWTFTIGCGAVGAIILLSLILATCFCRSIPSGASRKSSSSSSSPASRSGHRGLATTLPAGYGSEPKKHIHSHHK